MLRGQLPSHVSEATRSSLRPGKTEADALTIKGLLGRGHCLRQQAEHLGYVGGWVLSSPQGQFLLSSQDKGRRGLGLGGCTCRRELSRHQGSHRRDPWAWVLLGSSQ